MSFRFFTPPSSRAKFERNLYFLAEAIRGGRFNVAPGLTHTIDGIRRVRYLPNHRVDLLTIDEATRLAANMMTNSFDLEPTGRRPAAEGYEDDRAGSEPGEDADEKEGEDEDAQEDEAP